MRVKCKRISKTYETKNGSIPVLQDISFDTEEREFLCVLGPSGCGKTTLLRIIAGVLKPTSGIVTIEGEMSNSGPATALVFQEHGIFPWMNVIDNVCFGLEAQRISRAERYHRAMPLIEKMGLAGFDKNYPHQLSSGMKQRVGLARALVSGASILLMDEPFAALDAQMKLILQEQLLDIHREYRKSMIYVTHDIEEAILLADRIILMTGRPGQVKDEIKVPFARPRHLDIESTEEFARIRIEIWRQIKEEVERGLELTQ